MSCNRHYDSVGAGSIVNTMHRFYALNTSREIRWELIFGEKFYILDIDNFGVNFHTSMGRFIAKGDS